MTALAPENSKRSRVSSSVVDHLRELVASGQLAPGDRLPAERDLAERLGVGRNSIREALRELQMLGLVEARRGAGTFVRAADPSSLMAPFQTVISLSEAAVDDVMEFRRAFEPEVAALAARYADDRGIADLQAALRRFDQAVEAESDDRPYGADVDFHEVVARCTGNPLIIAVQHALAQLFAEMRSRLSDSSYQPDNRAARGHQALFGAIVAGDPDAARDVMRQHLDEVEESLGRWRNAAARPAPAADAPDRPAPPAPPVPVTPPAPAASSAPSAPVASSAPSVPAAPATPAASGTPAVAETLATPATEPTATTSSSREPV